MIIANITVNTDWKDTYNMIEFKGHLTGDAEKRYIKRAVAFGRNIMLVSGLFISPLVIYISIFMHTWTIIIGYSVLLTVILIASNIPLMHKDLKLHMPQKICIDTDDGIISYMTEQGEEDFKDINSATEVRDFMEFYEVVFPLGNYSERFICQKDLIVNGTLEEFETLFAGKITKIPASQRY